ncbi:CxxC motif-containing protein [Lachnospiraceae bacterium KH1T2]|nr:CxxC motif-containing protein [Lachnospiraceae bacterium KH1T2]
METRELTCIGCPMGCQITVELDKGEVVSVTGNTCARGDIYARKEVTNPTRIVTSTIIIKNGDKPRVSCKTANDIPKGKIFEVMKDIDAAVAEAPVKIGDVLVKDVAGTGVDVIATRNIAKMSDV